MATLNDASALVIYRLAVAAGAARALSFGQVVGSFALVAIVVIGLVAGAIANWLMVRLQDHFLEILGSLLAAFISYLGAELVHGTAGRRR